MRTNIEIDDDLMAAAMAAGGFKTKKEAVEEGLKLLRRRQVYDGLLALRGKLQWDDSDEAWARARVEAAEASTVQEPDAPYASKARQPVSRKPAAVRSVKPTGRVRSRRT